MQILFYETLKGSGYMAGIKEIFITENGGCFKVIIKNGSIIDGKESLF
jgi:hypothetical protein